MRLVGVIFCILLSNICWLADAHAARQASIKYYTIVIDAGHGGKDPGARGSSGIYEKEVVLQIAKGVAEEINRSKNMRALLTRKGDYYVPLRERLRLARKSKADVFISIHADAYFKIQASGMSVYALSEHGATSEAARWLAQQDKYPELGAIELDDLHDQSRVLRSVLIDLAQTATIRESIRLGNNMLDALDDISSLHYARVERAPFLVLKSPDIPSILIETGYISNPIEERLLAEPSYQDELAHAICKGIKKYLRHVHRADKAI